GGGGGGGVGGAGWQAGGRGARTGKRGGGGGGGGGGPRGGLGGGGPFPPRHNSRRRSAMHTDISRREVIKAMGLGAAAIAVAEMGGGRPASAEDAFTIASTGGSWGDGLKQAYVGNPGFEKRAGTHVRHAPPT